MGISFTSAEWRAAEGGSPTVEQADGGLSIGFGVEAGGHLLNEKVGKHNMLLVD